MTDPRRMPCPSCPWRVDQHADAIPNFQIALAENLHRTCPDERGRGPEFGAPQFACHQSKPGAEIICSGWLAVEGHAHPGVRLNIATGRLSADALAPDSGWPALHGSFGEVISKLREDVSGSHD